MKIKNLIFFVFVLISAQKFSQELSLEIYSQNSDENRLLSTVNFNKNFSDFEELKNELNFVIEKLKKIGFINAVTIANKPISPYSFGDNSFV